jgi:ATP-dependent Clp protease ATP-binding subunit ClpC
MFERFNEAARRALFFARYEASQLGGVSIETEHVLLGLAREPRGVIASLLTSSGTTLKTLREVVEAECQFRERVSTSVEIPFSMEVKRALELTATEADGLNHGAIAPEHMLLGLLRVEGSVAERILTRNGLRLNTVRDETIKLRSGQHAGWTPPVDVFHHIERIKSLVAQLSEVASDPQATVELAHVIHIELSSLVAGLTPGESE